MNFEVLPASKKIDIVEDVIIGSSRPESTIIPDNRAEVLIPLNSNLIISNMGYAKPMKLEKEVAYFLKPRRRGLIMENSADYLLIKINPIYSKYFIEYLPELQCGVHLIPSDYKFIEDIISKALKHKVASINKLLSVFVERIGFNYNSTIINSINLIRNSNGTILIRDLYASMKISKSKLEHHFNKEIGLTPKEFCRIEKINAFIEKYKKDKEKKLTELTYKCGYYDQSHLIKDFQYFLNTSPKKYLNSAWSIGGRF